MDRTSNSKSARLVKTLLLGLSAIGSLNAYGLMTYPYIRPVTPAFRKLLPPEMSNLSDYEIQRYPLEYIKEFFPDEDYSNVYNMPCRGIKNSGLELSTFKSGEYVDIEWTIQNSYEGLCSVTLNSAITGEKYLLGQKPCGYSEGPDSMEVLMPDTQEIDCSVVGSCYIQWKWYAQKTDEFYVNCADVYIIPRNYIPKPTPRVKIGDFFTTTNTSTETVDIQVGETTISKTITRSGDHTQTITVNYTTTQTVTIDGNNHGYTIAPYSIPIPQNQYIEGEKRCCGQPNQYCIFRKGRWEGPIPLTNVNGYKCQNQGKDVIVVKA